MKYIILSITLLIAIVSCSDKKGTVGDTSIQPALEFKDLVEVSTIDSVFWWANSVKVKLETEDQEGVVNAMGKMSYLPDTTLSTMAGGYIVYVAGERYTVSTNIKSDYAQVEVGLITKNVEYVDTANAYLYFHTNGFNMVK